MKSVSVQPGAYVNRFTHEREVVIVLIVEGQSEGGTSRGTCEDGVVAVACRPDHLVEWVEPARRGPVAAGVEVRVQEEDIELCFVL